MSLYSYKVFLEVADSGSFVRASEKLNLSPSAVSHAVKALENEFGFSLFNRNRAGAVLTGSGQRVIPYVRSLIKLQNNLEQEVNIINHFDVGAVRIAMFSSVASNWFIRIRRHLPAGRLCGYSEMAGKRRGGYGLHHRRALQRSQFHAP